MKKFVILFFLILLVKTTCFSQNILVRENNDTVVLITPNQLKEANLVFIEHQKLLRENNLLLKQISNYKLDNELLLKMDSLRTLQLLNYEELTKSYNFKIEQLNKEIKRKNNALLAWKIGGVTVSAGLLIWLLLK